MLVGLAALDRLPDAVIVIDNASTDHTPGRARRRDQPGLQVVRTEDNLGGAGGFHLGVRTAYEAGFDRIWLMDDDVVPAPDCLTVLMARDEDCLMAVREDTAGRLVEKAATRFDLRNPLAIRPKTGMVETDYGSRGPDARAGRGRERRLRGLHGAAARWSTRSGCPTRRTSSSTTTSTSPCAPGGPASGSGRCATRCWCASSTSTSSTT